MELKAYSWALDGLAALVLLVGLILMFIYQSDMELLVIRVVGLGVLFFTLMRIKPIIAHRDEKDYLILMLLEILVALVVGIMLLFFPAFVETSELFTFGRLTGAIFYIRGIVHFYTTAKRYELHDLIGFIVHIVLISFGFYFLLTGLEVSKVVYIIYFIALVLVGYFGYRSWTGYNRFRIEKANQLKMQDFLEKEEEEEKTIDDPKSIDDVINPEVYEEPEDNRPSIDVQ